jgi:hypothetical protein
VHHDLWPRSNETENPETKAVLTLDLWPLFYLHVWRKHIFQVPQRRSTREMNMNICHLGSPSKNRNMSTEKAFHVLGFLGLGD